MYINSKLSMEENRDYANENVSKNCLPESGSQGSSCQASVGRLEFDKEEENIHTQIENSDIAKSLEQDLCALRRDAQRLEDLLQQIHEKRKGVNDEDVLQPMPKRLCQGQDCGNIEHLCSLLKTSGTLDSQGTSSSSNLTAIQRINHSELVVDKGRLPNDNQSELEQDLDETSETRFTWEFWTNLHNNRGSTIGYSLGFLIVLLMNHSWMLEEIADDTEGHSVSKTFVILFLIYSYSFITLGLEAVQLGILISEIYFPYPSYKLKQHVRNLQKQYAVLDRMKSYEYCHTILAVLCCILHAAVGSIIWTWFWWNHICKSFHDRTCRRSKLGQLIIAYRDSACYDGKASSIICEKFVSYLPIMLLSVLLVFLANVLLPLVNDQLALIYSSTVKRKFEAAIKIVDGKGRNEVINDIDPTNSTASTGFSEFCLTKKNFDFSRDIGKHDSFVNEDAKSDFENTASSEVFLGDPFCPTEQPALSKTGLMLTVMVILIVDLFLIVKLNYGFK